LNKAFLVSKSATHKYIFLSNLPLLKSAESKWSGLFVAAITIKFGASSASLLNSCKN